MLIILFTLFFFVFAGLAGKIIYIFQAKGSALKAMSLVFVFAVIFTESSIFWTKDTTYHVEVIKPIETGWPISFHYIPHPMNQAWETPSDNRNNFFSSVLINSGLWGAGFFLFACLLRKIGVVMKPLSSKSTLIAFAILISTIIGLNFVNLKIYEWKNLGMNNPVMFPPTLGNIAPSPTNASTTFTLPWDAGFTAPGCRQYWYKWDISTNSPC